jgi:trk system potassium uptake protein TrkH
MHIALLIRIAALLALIVTMAMLPSTFVSLYCKEYFTVLGFIKSMLLLAIPAAVVLFFTRKLPKSSLSTRDGFLVVFIAWLSVVFYALPFILTGALETWPDSFFEASSGITTTGGTVVVDVEALPYGVLLWRSICLWMGGMGIVVLAVAIMPLLGIGNMQLFKAESGGMDKERLTPRIAKTAKILWLIYLFFTVTIALLFHHFGMSAFDAINHAMSAIASGGFSTKNSSICYFNSVAIEWVAVGAMFVSGVNFALFFRLFSGKVTYLFKNSELKAYILIIFFATTIVTLINYISGSYATWASSLRSALFQSVAVITSAGFSIVDYGQWPYICQFVLLVLFFVGGCSGSTAGGFKVMRVVILLKQAVNGMRTLLHPRGVFPLRLNGTVLGNDMINGVSGFLFLYICSVIVVSGVASTAGVDIFTAISTGLSTMGNVGLGFEGIGPTETYAKYPAYVKMVLSVAMIVGRLEIYTFFMLLMPFFWKR